MAYRLPDEIPLLGKIIHVRRVPLFEKWGQYTPSRFLVEISTECPEYMLEDVLFHELAHAVFEITGNTNLMSVQLEESLCRALENLAPIYKLRTTRASKSNGKDTGD